MTSMIDLEEDGSSSDNDSDDDVVWLGDNLTVELQQTKPSHETPKTIDRNKDDPHIDSIETEKSSTSASAQELNNDQWKRDRTKEVQVMQLIQNDLDNEAEQEQSKKEKWNKLRKEEAQFMKAVWEDVEDKHSPWIEKRIPKTIDGHVFAKPDDLTDLKDLIDSEVGCSLALEDMDNDPNSYLLTVRACIVWEAEKMSRHVEKWLTHLHSRYLVNLLQTYGRALIIRWDLAKRPQLGLKIHYLEGLPLVMMPKPPERGGINACCFPKLKRAVESFGAIIFQNVNGQRVSTIDDFKRIMKTCREGGEETIMELGFLQMPAGEPWKRNRPKSTNEAKDNKKEAVPPFKKQPINQQDGIQQNIDNIIVDDSDKDETPPRNKQGPINQQDGIQQNVDVLVIDDSDKDDSPPHKKQPIHPQDGIQHNDDIIAIDDSNEDGKAPLEKAVVDSKKKTTGDPPDTVISTTRDKERLHTKLDENREKRPKVTASSHHASSTDSEASCRSPQKRNIHILNTNVASRNIRRRVHFNSTLSVQYLSGPEGFRSKACTALSNRTEPLEESSFARSKGSEIGKNPAEEDNAIMDLEDHNAQDGYLENEDKSISNTLSKCLEENDVEQMLERVVSRGSYVALFHLLEQGAAYSMSSPHILQRLREKFTKANKHKLDDRTKKDRLLKIFLHAQELAKKCFSWREEKICHFVLNAVHLKFSDDTEIESGEALSLLLKTDTEGKYSLFRKTEDRTLPFFAKESFSFGDTTQSLAFKVAWNAFSNPYKTVEIQLLDTSKLVLGSVSLLASDLLIVDQENKISNLHIQLTEHGLRSLTEVSIDLCFSDGRMDDRILSQLRDAQLKKFYSCGYMKHLHDVISWVEAWNKEDSAGCKLARIPILQTTLLESSIRMADESAVNKMRSLGADVTKETLAVARKERGRPSDICTVEAANVCDLIEKWHEACNEQNCSLEFMDKKYDGLQGSISEISSSWLFSLERMRRFESKRCGDFDRNGRCPRGQTCLFAHVRKEGQPPCLSKSSFNSDLVETKHAYDDFGNKRCTAGYCDGNELFYAAENEGMLCASSGIWWWNTEAQAVRALKATVTFLRNGHK